MKDFLIKNWYYIILAFVAVAGFVSSLIIALKKGKNPNLFDSIKTALLENIPFWAVMSEGLVSGADKRNNVITLGIALVRKLLGRDLSADENNYFVAFVSENLEKILTAPQKKLKTAEIKQKSRYATFK